MHSPPADRVPELAWRLVALLTLTVSLVVLAAVELSLRALGFGPSVSDTVALFAKQLDATNDADVIALVGSSAFQVGLDPDQLEQAFPGRRVANLALIGQSPIPVLEHLAHQTGFRGIVVFEFLPIRLFTPDTEDVLEAGAYLRRTEAVGAYSGLETDLRLGLQTRLALFNPEVRLEGFVRTLLAGQLPKPHQEFRANRFAPRDYSGQDVSLMAEKRDRIWRERVAREGLHGDAFAPRFAALQAAAHAIRARGGEVVFFRIHSSGQALALEEELFPRTQYWDLFARDCPGACLHFADIASAEAVELAEGSHADRRDTAKVTAALIEGLRQAHVLTGATP